MALGSCNGIEGQLYAIRYPDDKGAGGTVEVFSNGHPFGGEHCLLAQIGNKAALADLRNDDFGVTVAVAARKLSLDLGNLAVGTYKDCIG